MYFRIPKDIHVAQYGSDIIILDALRDKYFSITDGAAAMYSDILKNEFQLTGSAYRLTTGVMDSVKEQSFTQMIQHFLEQGFIEQSTESGGEKKIMAALKEGGLSNYRWDYKSSLAPFSRVSKKEILHALICLFRVHSLLKRKGIQGILLAIEKSSQEKIAYTIPSDEQLAQLSDSIDVACALYPKKVYCLGWASTFVLRALSKGWRCNLAIGVQALPFYAHAWAECDGKVINDEQIVQEYLSVLLQTPFK